MRQRAGAAAGEAGCILRAHALLVLCWREALDSCMRVCVRTLPGAAGAERGRLEGVEGVKDHTASRVTCWCTSPHLDVCVCVCQYMCVCWTKSVVPSSCFFLTPLRVLPPLSPGVVRLRGLALLPSSSPRSFAPPLFFSLASRCRDIARHCCLALNFSVTARAWRQGSRVGSSTPFHMGLCFILRAGARVCVCVCLCAGHVKLKRSSRSKAVRVQGVR